MKNLFQKFIFLFSKKYTIQDILEKDSIEFTKSNRKNIQFFKKKGFSCVSCGRKGHYFKKTGNSYKLYTKDHILMTKDHILPKSKGGVNNLYNLQPMCYLCNQKKANKVPEKGTYLKIKNKEKTHIINRIKGISKLEKKEVLTDIDKRKVRNYLHFLFQEKKLYIVLFENEIEKLRKIPLNTLKGISEINNIIIDRIR